MARFGGPGGMGGLGNMGDISKLMKQAQKMQEDAEKLQADLPSIRVEATAGGGMVTVTVNGYGQLVGISINPSIIDPNDAEILEDLIITASKEASAKAQAMQDARMEEISGPLKDIKLPPGLLGG